MRKKSIFSKIKLKYRLNNRLVMDKKNIVSFINSFSYPYIGAIASIKNRKIFLESSSIYNNEKFHPYQSGLIVNKDNSGFKIITIDGIINVKKIKNSKGKVINSKIRSGLKIENYHVKSKTLFFNEKKKYNSGKKYF